MNTLMQLWRLGAFLVLFDGPTSNVGSDSGSCFLQALISLQYLEKTYDFSYYMHADDDSYVRLDLLLPLLVSVVFIVLGQQCRNLGPYQMMWSL